MNGITYIYYNIFEEAEKDQLALKVTIMFLLYIFIYWKQIFRKKESCRKRKSFKCRTLLIENLF